VRLGLNLGYWRGGDPAGWLDLAREADRLGFAVCWAAEAYGCDAPTILSFVAAHTTRIDIGSAILQIPARAPAMTAMTAATLDALSGGRFRLGLGVSGPQVSEGWYGVPYDKPLARTREYVEIVAMALRGERLTYTGGHWTLPLPGGPGKPLRLMFHPVRDRVPVYLASLGPRNLELTGEIADGWLGLFPATRTLGDSLSHLRVGRERAGRTLEGFDVAPSLPMVVGDDVAACADAVRPYAALYLGGMGSRNQNFYNELARRMGYGDAAERVQDAYLAGRNRDAAAAVPYEFLDETSLLGSVERIAERLAAYAGAGVTTLNVMVPGGDEPERAAARPVTLRRAAEALDMSGVGE
jgi:F420-dependent oxidoreductase-like protein